MHFDSKINILVLKCLAALPYTVVVQNNHMRVVLHYHRNIMSVLRCSSASNRIISAKDHASIQINIAEVCF